MSAGRFARGMRHRGGYNRRGWGGPGPHYHQQQQQQHQQQQRDIVDFEPSPVLHVRDLPEHTLEADLLLAFGGCGAVKEVCMLPHKAQALVEFHDIGDARAALQLVRDQAPGRIKVSYSTSKQIVLSGGGENRVLLLTVYRPEQPIGVHVVQRICAPHGRVRRVVVFRKTHLQAMVEFASAADAVRAKRQLNGADVYDGCCTLKVEFAQPTELTVTRNDEESWDYDAVQPPGASAADAPSEPAPTPSIAAGLAPPPMAMSPPDPLALVTLHGLADSTFNCQRVFNLLCLYSNVGSVRFPGGGAGVVAVAEVGDRLSARRIVECLDGVRLFGQRLRLAVGNTAPEEPPATAESVPPPMWDGSPSLQEFVGSRNNRFTTPEQAQKNKVRPPFRALHFWNCPPAFHEHQLKQLLQQCGCQLPQSVLRFTNARATDRTSGGMVQWLTETQAAEALVLSNNTDLGSSEQHGLFVLRLCFANRAIGQREDQLPSARDMHPSV